MEKEVKITTFYSVLRTTLFQRLSGAKMMFKFSNELKNYTLK